MGVNREQIEIGLIKFIEEDIIPVVGDKNFQIVLTIGTEILKTNLDKLLKNQMITALFPYNEKEKTWDTKGFKLLKDTLRKYGSLKVIVPAIPFVSPEEKELKFGVEDIEKIESFIS